MEPRNFNPCWDRQIKRAGVKQITVHDARRTCATLLRDLNVYPRVAQQIVRHAQVSITREIYTEVTDEATRDALRRLARRWSERRQPTAATANGCTLPLTSLYAV